MLDQEINKLAKDLHKQSHYFGGILHILSHLWPGRMEGKCGIMS